MKPRRGNGTPHPKGRRSSVHTSHEEPKQSNQIQHSEPDLAKQDQNKSPLQNLLHVHTQVTHTLHQIDTMMLNIHNLASSKRVAPDEVQDFAYALTSMGANLQDWNDFLKAAAERWSLSHSNLEQEPYNIGSPEPTLVHRENCTSPSSPVSDSECGSISYSPLVATNMSDCESPCGNELLTCTPLVSTGCSRSSTSLSPLPPTPCVLSPPRSVRVLSTISESPSLSTLDHLTFQSHLVFETPPSQVTRNEYFSDGLSFPLTSGFSASPLRTCRPQRPEETTSTESDTISPTPLMPSPFRTPGISLNCSSAISESSSASSQAIIDDITASTVKRLGERGLEERLWQELIIHQADVFRSVKLK